MTNKGFLYRGRKILTILIVFILIIVMTGMLNTQFVGQNHVKVQNYCCSNPTLFNDGNELSFHEISQEDIDRGRARYNYTVDEIRHLLNSDEIIYQNIRFQSDNDGTRTHKVPVADCEINLVLGAQYSKYLNFQPFNAANAPYERIRTSLLPNGNRRPNADAIVIVLMGDGFVARSNNVDECVQGRWPNPRAGTLVWHADGAITALEETHPFSLFVDYFTVYVIQVATSAGQAGRLGTVTSTGELSTAINATRIREYADARVPRTEQTMLQVISNARYGTGFAFMSWHYTLVVDISVTSLRTATSGGDNTIWPRDLSEGVPVTHNGTAWHGTFIHEFGHSFGQLVDNHFDGTRDNRRANSQSNATASNAKWGHWFGHRNVAITPQETTRYIYPRPATTWYVPSAYTTAVIDGVRRVSGGNCIMTASWANRNFNGVSRAELIRRMTLITPEAQRETFMGRSPTTANTIANTPANRYVIVRQTHHNRVLDSAFHGNTILHTVTIPANITTIGDFAFLGATGLRIIHNNATTPQPINNTTFANSGTTANGNPNQLNRSIITVFIPRGTYSAYRAAGWTGFNLVELRIQGPTWMETGSFINLSLPHGVETSNIEWSIQSGSGTLLVQNNGRTARLSSLVVGMIQVRVNINGFIIIHSVTVNRPPCICDPRIIQLCCCMGDWCPGLNQPWGLDYNGCCFVLLDIPTPSQRCC